MARLLRYILGLSLLCLLGGILWLQQPPAPALVHLPLALGVMPLIFAATGYFTPVLTRSGNLRPVERVPVFLAIAAGTLIVSALQWGPAHFHLAALVGLVACSLQLALLTRRGKLTLGSPHPGLLWYKLALIALMLGLVAILLGRLLPDHWQALRRLHLHLNLLGFIGLTALGTLRVLIPTVGGYTDPKAAQWLSHAPWMSSAGVALIALGAAWQPLITPIGLLALLWPIGSLIGELASRRRQLINLHGAAPSLLGAIMGLLLALIAGGAHALALIPADGAIISFLYSFLLPLITGAASHLLPLWLGHNPQHAGTNTPERLPGRYALLRTLLFLVAGLAALAIQPWAVWPALLALALFLGQCLRMLWRLRGNS